YWLLASQHGRSLVRLRLDTGRTHQIRVHLRAVGCPVVGDFLYGAEDAALPGRFALHSALVAVHHPFTGALIVRESALPPELQALMT
ncbi:MAG: RluA family pseudouridine synthase, partial [Clostridia bacterium]